MKMIDSGTWKRVLGIVYLIIIFFTIAEFGFVTRAGNGLLFILYEAFLVVAAVAAFLPAKRQNWITTLLVILPIVLYFASLFFVNVIPH